MAFVKLPEELLDADITAAQLRILANLIKYSFDDNHSYIGYTKLAEACFSSKSYIIKAMKDLEEKGFIKITHRGAFSRSNDILLTFERGLSACRKSGENLSGAAPKGCLNSTPKGCLNSTPKRCLNDTQGCLNDTPHKDIRFKYLDLNLNTREAGCLNSTPTPVESSEEKKIEPVDVATGRSMPNGEQVAESSAINEQVAPMQTELENFCLVEAFFGVFPNLRPWVKFAKVGGYFALQPIGSLGEKLLNEQKKRAAGWFELRGLKLAFVPYNQILKGVILGGAA